MSAVREQVLSQVVTALRQIGTSAAYSATEAPTVTRTRHPSVNLPSLPFIYVGGTREDYERDATFESAGTYNKVLTVEINYTFASADMDVDASRAVRDVEYALRDWTVAGKASELEIKSNEVFVFDEANPIVTVRFEVAIMYRVDDDAPDTRV